MTRNGFFFSIMAGLYLAPIIMILSAVFDNKNFGGPSSQSVDVPLIFFLSGVGLFLYGFVVDTLVWYRLFRLTKTPAPLRLAGLRLIPVFAIVGRFWLSDKITASFSRLTQLKPWSPSLYIWTASFLALRDCLFWGMIGTFILEEFKDVNVSNSAENILLYSFLAVLIVAGCLYAIVIWKIAGVREDSVATQI